MSDSAGILRSRAANVLVRVLKREAHALSSLVARYPVESGKSVSDHVALNPNCVDVSFEMPNSDNGVELARDVFQQFVKMRDDREPVTLDTEHARYKNMVVAAFSAEHAAPFKGALVANVRLQQVGIIGETDMVSARGGRPEGVLADDGTQKTACAAIRGGEQPGATSGVVLNNCGPCLARGGVNN